MQQPLAMDEDLLASENEAGGAAVATPTKKVSTHMKVLVVVMMFIVGIAIGSTGHSIFTYKAPPTPDKLAALSMMVSRMNISASPCSTLYTYACGRYVEKHFPFSGESVFGELTEEASAAAYHAFDAYAEANPSEPASIYYSKCQGAGQQIEPDCTVAAEPGPSLVRALWEHGFGVADLFVDRTTSPYVLNTRSFAIFLRSYTSGSLKRPLQVEAATDPCNLFGVLQLVYACDLCEDDVILLYGDTDAICNNWEHVQKNQTNASLVAQSLAQSECMLQMPSGRNLETCVDHTSNFYTTVSRAYVDAKKPFEASDKHIHSLFSSIKKTLAKIVRPLGDSVADKVAGVKLYTDWNANNQEPGPTAQALQRNQTYAALLLRSMRSKTMHSLQDRKFISPLWHMEAYEINAYYMPSENSIYLPPAMRVLLRGVDFSAALAFILGHELAHSIDPSSIDYNKDGQYDTQMLTDEGRQYYNRFLNCIRTNRQKQLSEDFADRVSTQVVSAVAPKSSVEFEFQTFTLTAGQSNVLQMAQLWCAAESHESFTDSHSPARLRVEESMSALFTHEFDCPVKQQTCILG